MDACLVDVGLMDVRWMWDEKGKWWMHGRGMGIELMQN